MSTKTANQWVRITKTVVDRMPVPTTGQSFLRDPELKGFGIRATSKGTKSFIFEKRVSGRVRRMTIGRYGELTVEQARRQAKILCGQIALGTDPIAERQQARVRATALGEAYHDFQRARKDLKPKTLYDYDRIMKTVFTDWQKKPITAITKRMVAKRHRELGETRGEHHANLSMRVLRTVLNFAQATYDDGNGRSLLLENPVSVLSQTRAWYRQERRRTVIKAYQLHTWYQAVQSLKASEEPDTSHAVADWLTLLLFTGLRRMEGLTLRWEHVDLEARTLTIPEPKNREPLELPLSDFIFDLFSKRLLGAENGYVFPGREGKGHLIEPKRPIRNVIERSGVHFIPHDLRRTFITVAESLNISPYSIKRLVNHKMSSDVTAGYIVMDVERLRKPMQSITDFLLRAINPPENVVTPIKVKC